MKKVISVVLFAVLGAFSLIANTSAYTGDLANEAISYNKAFILDVTGNNITYATAHATNTDATPVVKSFADGGLSSGSITIGTVSKLAAAAATDTITVVTLTGISGAGVSVGPVSGLPAYVFIEGRDWRKGSSTTTAALSLATAMTAKIPGLTFTPSGAIISISAPKTGTYYNSVPVHSNSATITVASAYLAGGQDDAVVTINGVVLKQGAAWSIGANPTAASTSLANAINANASLSPLITATANSPTAGITALVSDAPGAAKNFALTSSIPTYLTLSGDTMTGGSASAYTTGSALITIPAHRFNVGLPVTYADGAANLTPLVNGVVYYVSVVDANTIKLATTSARAVLGLGVTITATPAPIKTYTLTPTALAGTSSFKWETSNDALSWSDMSVASVTISDYGTLPLVTSWSFGNVGFHYLRLNVVAPTGGALGMKMTVNGVPYSEFARTAGDSFTGTVTHVNSPIVLTGSLGTITSASSISSLSSVVTGTGAAALDVAGGINAGSGNVGIVDVSGKIPAISSTYFASLSGANLTGLTAANISAGSLGGSVIASSIAVNAVQDGSIVGMTSSKLSGALPAISGASLTAVTASVLTGPLPAIDGALLTNVGTMLPEFKTVAKIKDLTGVVGKPVWCSDCIAPYSICVGTSTTSGAGATAYVLSGDGLACH